MRKFVLLAVVAALVLFAIGLAIAFGVHWAVSSTGTTLTIDGESFDGPMMALIVGAVAALALVIGGIVVVTLLASVALAIPLLLVLTVAAILFAAFVNIVPILVPVLLVVGAYVLLSRRARRRATVLPPSPTVS